MDFEVFNRTEIEDMCSSMIANMTEEQKTLFINEYGSIEAFREHFTKSASSEAAQKNFQKVVEWYGNKEDALNASKNPGNPELLSAYQKRLDTVMKKLAGKLDCDVRSFEVKEIIGEYDFLSKQMYQMKDVSAMMLELAGLYESNADMQKVQDKTYGAGFTVFLARALRAFYEAS